MVESVLDEEGLLVGLLLDGLVTSGDLSLSLRQETSLLLLLGPGKEEEGREGVSFESRRRETSRGTMYSLGLVLVEELEELGGGVLVEGVRELGDRRGDLRKKEERKRASASRREDERARRETNENEPSTSGGG